MERRWTLSAENVKLFYAELKRDRVLHERAMRLRTVYSRQEELIDAFLALARESGFPFSHEEFIAYVFEHGEEEKSS